VLQRINTIKHVEFSDKVYRLLDDCGLVHYEDILFERLLLGYNIMKGTFGPEFVIDVDTESERLVRTAARHLTEVKRGAEYSMVIVILSEHDRKMTLVDLKERLLKYGLDWSQSAELIDSMRRLRIIKPVGQEIVLNPHIRR